MVFLRQVQRGILRQPGCILKYPGWLTAQDLELINFNGGGRVKVVPKIGNRIREKR